MLLEGRAVLLPGDNVDTDVLYPGAYLSIDDPAGMRLHLFAGLDPALRDHLVGDTVLVVGENFGTGSSREHVVQAMRASGVRFILGRSFARIFARNCLNLGLPALVCPGAVDLARAGSTVRTDIRAGAIWVDGTLLTMASLPDFVIGMLMAGGLVEWSRQQLTQLTTRDKAHMMG